MLGGAYSRLLVQGLRKEIGNGRTIFVGTDEWIVGDGRRSPLMKNCLVDINLKVADLIDVWLRRWNMEMLEDLFYPEDIQSIIKMKPVINHDDFWIWVHNKWGAYTVKSEYWMINRVVNAELIQEAEMKPSLNGLKAAIWKIKTSPKIKSFMWKAVSNAIPVGDLLITRGVKMDPCCQVCGFQGESVNHLVFTCDVARQVWALSNIPMPEVGFPGSFYANFHYLMSMDKKRQIPSEVKRTFPWVIWYLWKTRNGVLFEGNNYQSSEIMEKIGKEVELWFLAQELEREREVEVLVEKKRIPKVWQPPSRSWYKCNIGFCWNHRKQIGGASWVLRDDAGCVMMHSRRVFLSCNDMHMLKLKAILWTIESMGSHRLNRVIFSFDDAMIFGMITRHMAWPSFKFQISEIMRRLASFEWWRVSKEDRATNRGASLIAQSAAKELRMQSYVACGYPFWLKELFESERSSPSV